MLYLFFTDGNAPTSLFSAGGHEGGKEQGAYDGNYYILCWRYSPSNHYLTSAVDRPHPLLCTTKHLYV